MLLDARGVLPDLLCGSIAADNTHGTVIGDYYGSLVVGSLDVLEDSSGAWLPRAVPMEPMTSAGPVRAAGTLSAMDDVDLFRVELTAAVGTFPEMGWGGLGAGMQGNRRVSGTAINKVWDQEKWSRVVDVDWAFNVIKHEAGHATGYLPRIRHVRGSMADGDRVLA
jgi:hypothetical protein